MVVQLVKIQCELENLESLSIPRSHEWRLDVSLGNGEEMREGVLLSVEEEVEIPNSRGTTNLVLKIDKSRYATITVEQLPKIVKAEITGGNVSVPVLALDCRSCEVLAWKPTGFYVAKAESGTVFDEVELAEGDWYDVDPETNEPVSITNVRTSIENYKK